MSSFRSLLLTTFTTLLVLTHTCMEAKSYSRCELAKELQKNGFPRSFLSNWVCLVEAESGRQTTKVTEFPNLTKSYGIFQINSRDWCRSQRKGGDCNMRCEDFLNDNIKDDVECAKLIYSRRGFDGWKGWQTRCKGKPLPDVSRC